jgi:hypothetical protein
LAPNQGDVEEKSPLPVESTPASQAVLRAHLKTWDWTDLAWSKLRGKTRILEMQILSLKQIRKSE